MKLHSGNDHLMLLGMVTGQGYVSNNIRSPIAKLSIP
jgi:hypothetical protein